MLVKEKNVLPSLGLLVTRVIFFYFSFVSDDNRNAFDE